VVRGPVISGPRPQRFFLFSIVICVYLVYSRVYEQKKKRNKVFLVFLKFRWSYQKFSEWSVVVKRLGKTDLYERCTIDVPNTNSPRPIWCTCCTHADTRTAYVTCRRPDSIPKRRNVFETQYNTPYKLVRNQRRRFPRRAYEKFLPGFFTFSLVCEISLKCSGVRILTITRL